MGTQKEKSRVECDLATLSYSKLGVALALLSLLFIGSLIAPPAATAVVSSGKVKTIEIKGYITEVTSPTTFEIEDYKMTLEGKYDVELQNVESKAIKFDPAVHLRVGTLVKIKAKVNTENLEASVQEVKVDVKQFRRLSHTTVLDTSPTGLEKDENGKWRGEILADARRVTITPETDVRFKLNKSEEREKKEKEKEKELSEEDKLDREKVKAVERAEDQLTNKNEDDDFEEEQLVEEELQGSRPLQSLGDVGPGVYLTYKGIENLKGDLVASTVVFTKNEKTKQEKEYWHKLRIKEKESKKAKSFDKLKIAGDDYKVLTEDDIQEYVDSLGKSLVPEYQRNLPDDDENKIPFRFVVVYNKGINAGAYATGTIVVNHDVFTYLENEAQLAFLLSHEIAHATQEHSIRELNHKKKTRTWLKIGSIAAYAMGYGLIARTLAMTEQAMRMGYSRSIENQSDRIGLATMVRHGYDPREAPRLWKVSSMAFGDENTDAFWSSHSSNAERRSYLMVTIRNTYPSLDYSTLRKDSPDFHRIAKIVQEKYPSKRKRRNV